MVKSNVRMLSHPAIVFGDGISTLFVGGSLPWCCHMQPSFPWCRSSDGWSDQGLWCCRIQRWFVIGRDFGRCIVDISIPCVAITCRLCDGKWQLSVGWMVRSSVTRLSQPLVLIVLVLPWLGVGCYHSSRRMYKRTGFLMCSGLLEMVKSNVRMLSHPADVLFAMV